jgi:hypothetical protein
MTEFAPAIRTNTAIVLALAERSCSRGAIVRATRFHVPQLSSTRGSPRPLCRIRTSALPSPKPALQRAEPGARAGLCGTTQMPAISIEGDDFGRGSLVPRLAQRTLWLVVGRRVRLDLLGTVNLSVRLSRMQTIGSRQRGSMGNPCRKFADSPLEGTGFELVAGFEGNVFMPLRSRKLAREQRPVLTTDNGGFTVGQARLAPAMISTPGHRASRRRQREALPAWCNVIGEHLQAARSNPPTTCLGSVQCPPSESGSAGCKSAPPQKNE